MMMANTDHKVCKTPTRNQKRHRPRTINFNETSEGVPRWCHNYIITPKDDLYAGATQCKAQEKHWKMLHEDLDANRRVHNSPEGHGRISIRCHDLHLEETSGKHCHSTRSRRSLSCTHKAAPRASSEENCIDTSKDDGADFKTPKEHSFRTCFCDKKTAHVLDKEKSLKKRRPMSSTTRGNQDEVTTILRQALYQCRFALVQTMRKSKARTELHGRQQPRLQIHGKFLKVPWLPIADQLTAADSVSSAN